MVVSLHNNNNYSSFRNSNDKQDRNNNNNIKVMQTLITTHTHNQPTVTLGFDDHDDVDVVVRK